MAGLCKKARTGSERSGGWKHRESDSLGRMLGLVSTFVKHAWQARITYAIDGDFYTWAQDLVPSIDLLDHPARVGHLNGTTKWMDELCVLGEIFVDGLCLDLSFCCTQGLNDAGDLFDGVVHDRLMGTSRQLSERG